MSYSLDDRAAFLRAERDWLTPREEPECVCDRRGCDTTHPDEDTARDAGWTVVHSDDADVVLCPECTAADAAQDAADLASGAYFTPGVTQATGALDPCETCPPLDASLCDDCFVGDEPTCPACYLPRSEHTPQMLRACRDVLARLARFERLQAVAS